jgi:hypothetical protein
VLLIRIYFTTVFGSVADPWHFGTDPVWDSAIFVSALQEANKSFLFLPPPVGIRTNVSFPDTENHFRYHRCYYYAFTLPQYLAVLRIRDILVVRIGIINQYL